MSNGGEEEAEMRLANEMIAAAENDDLVQFTTLARDAQDIQLNLSLSSCRSIAIVRYIVIDRGVSDTLSDCYAAAIRREDENMIQFIEKLENDDIIRTMIDDAVGDIMSTLSVTESADAADRLIALSASRLGTELPGQDDATIVSDFVRARKALVVLVKSKLPEAWARIEEELARWNDVIPQLS